MSTPASPTGAPLLVAVGGGIATVTLNRPGQFNALSSALLAELQAAFDGIAADPAVRVVVLAANGRGFCAGHDLKELRALPDVADVEALFARCSRMMLTITRLPHSLETLSAEPCGWASRPARGMLAARARTLAL